MRIRYDVSPRLQMLLGLNLTAIGALGGAGAQLTTLFGEGPASRIAAGASLASLVLGPVVAALGAGSSTQPGPLATPDMDRPSAARRFP